MPPAPPPTGNWHEMDTTAMIEALRQARRAAGLLEAQLRRRSVQRAALEAFRAEIDEVAFMITGDRTFFQGKNSTG